MVITVQSKSGNEFQDKHEKFCSTRNVVILNSPILEACSVTCLKSKLLEVQQSIEASIVPRLMFMIIQVRPLQ